MVQLHTALACSFMPGFMSPGWLLVFMSRACSLGLMPCIRAALIFAASKDWVVAQLFNGPLVEFDGGTAARRATNLTRWFLATEPYSVDYEIVSLATAFACLPTQRSESYCDINPQSLHLAATVRLCVIAVRLTRPWGCTLQLNMSQELCKFCSSEDRLSGQHCCYCRVSSHLHSCRSLSQI
jgi:hypothetical protein